jgi:hypothetical protein
MKLWHAAAEVALGPLRRKFDVRLVAAVLPVVLLAGGAYAERPTERYASAQLRVAQDMLQRARAAAALGDTARAGRLAWQARSLRASPAAR